MNVVRVRWAIRAVLALGVAASTAANILHAADNPISQAIAAWPPLALLITIEVVARVPVHRQSLAVARRLAAVVIAGIAAWVSYWHMAGVAVRYGETGASAYLLPLSVDGLILVASICLVELSGRVDSAPDSEPANHPATEPARAAATPPAIEVDSPPGQVDSAVDRWTDSLSTAADATLPNPVRVFQAHHLQPDATDGQLADLLGVSTKTVQRYRPKAAAGQTNGHDHRPN